MGQRVTLGRVLKVIVGNGHAIMRTFVHEVKLRGLKNVDYIMLARRVALCLGIAAEGLSRAVKGRETGRQED